MRRRIVRLGTHAVRFIRRHGRARIAAVFTRSLHIVAGDDLLCVGGLRLGNGPLNAVLDVLPSDGWVSCAGPVGEDVQISERRLRLGELILDASGADEWQPPAWPRQPIEGDLRSGLASLRRMALRLAPHDGLARLALGILSDPAREASVLERVAEPDLRSLADWLAGERCGAAANAPPTGLLGLGPGLTPSGDDVLCGVLIALHALDRRPSAVALAAAIGQDVRRLTSPLSCAFLRAAGDGQGSELLHAAIRAVMDGDARALATHIPELGHVGHTSGWDALAGAALALGAGRRP